jgi:hypothetical protein
MCKRGGTQGSGSYTWFNGWFNILFPYIDKRPNACCVPYSSGAGYVKEGLVWDKTYNDADFDHPIPAGVAGPDCEDFGSGISSAPVTWSYYGEEHKLDFNAGFIGAIQDATTLCIRPQIGWYITRA